MSLPEEVSEYGQVLVKIGASLQPGVRYLQHVESQPDKKWRPDERIVNLREELSASLIGQKELKLATPPALFKAEHDQFLEAYKDIIDGIEYMIDSFSIEEKKLSAHQYDFGYHIQKAGMSKALSSFGSIMSKINK